MKLRDPRLIRLAAWLAARVIRVWVATLRYRIDTRCGIEHPADPERERFIYAFWHESILAMVRFRAPVHVLISRHADGELIAQVCRHLGLGTVRGSTTRGGGAGLLGLMEKARSTHLGITPDGPRGPRREVQIGTVVVASQTGLRIVPVGFGFKRARRAKSWDRFVLPGLFSRVICVVGEPITVPAGLDREALEEYRLVVQRRFLEATAEAERLAGGASASGGSGSGPHGPPRTKGKGAARVLGPE